ncbi:uncharacterized protein NP_3894B [Natronomonas pharaonis DSM 2160]|uniref:Uncharacterized protein n=1 Tax=Natronomonas pharaonis (strain ATCC 35678 / DSM 2160 / CIP 103997 / JCM 8858 / NBRC 14720 / NCIMB 2260 / Gabara) TaxID=348780 RepID=A0A1U7F3L4_NATPD|nr:uncharacterized protein NP_3894B [Natronomonas pharaonis DSM 2160]
MNENEIDPETYVEKNSDQLVYIIKHSNDRFIRGLCLAALVKYGGEKVGKDQIEKELAQLRDVEGI